MDTGAPRICARCLHERKDWDYSFQRRVCNWCRAADQRRRRADRKRSGIGSGNYTRTDRHRELIAIGMRMRRWWTLEGGVWMKICRACMVTKPEHEFRRHRGRCRECEAEAP